jgi:hypothetical protein
MMIKMKQTSQVDETYVIRDHKEFVPVLEQVYGRLVSEVVIAGRSR